MRYRPEHKAEVHRKIVRDGAHRVRAEGMNGAAVATVMRANGLTHGGFYRHFRSKDELLVQSLAEAFREVGDRLAEAAERAGREAAWKAIVRFYLSSQHCEHAEKGCPLAALAPELARARGPIRRQVAAQVHAYTQRVLPFMPGRRAADKQRAFYVIFSTMVGAIAMARTLSDRSTKECVLASARESLFRTF